MTFAPWVLGLGLGFAIIAGLVLAIIMKTPREAKRSEAWRLEQLRRAPVFQGLSDDLLRRVAALVREVRLPPDVRVLRENRVGDAMFIVVAGTLHILKRGTHDDTLVQTIGPGELIGEMALMTGGRRVASARSITPCLLLQIDRDDLHDRLATEPQLADAVWEACERHTLDLAARDHERLRALSADQLKTWIASRTVCTTTSGQRLTPPAAGYLGVVSGSVTVGAKTVTAPDLVRVLGDEEITALDAGRVCWLGQGAPGPSPTIREVARRAP